MTDLAAKSETGAAPAVRRRTRAAPPVPEDTGFPQAASGSGERKSISLGAAGTVGVVVDVRWLDLPDETFTNLRRIIKELEALSVEDAAPAPNAEAQVHAPNEEAGKA